MKIEIDLNDDEELTLKKLHVFYNSPIKLADLTVEKVAKNVFLEGLEAAFGEAMRQVSIQSYDDLKSK